MLFNYLSLAHYLSINTTQLECITGMVLLGLGMGLFMSPNHSAVMGTVPKTHLGVVSSLLILSRTLGMIAGVSILGAFWTYRVQKYSLEIFSRGLNGAPVEARISGLQDVFILALSITACAFIVLVCSLVLERKNKRVFLS